MTRTKKPRKNSSIKKEIGRSNSSYSSVSSDSSLINSSRKQSIFFARNYESTGHFLKEFELFYETKLKARRNLYESACEHVKAVFEETIKNLPEIYLNSSIRGYFDEDVLKVGNNDLSTAGPKAHLASSRARKPEATTCEFKRPKTPRVNRSSSRKRSVSAPPPMSTPSSDRFKTPSNSLWKLAPMSVITPKVANTPMCFLRRPEHGEVAFAASGSPLLVGRVSLEDIPTVTVPLQDGRIFSILPDPGAAPPRLPEFDEETKRYLKTLRQHLELLAPSSP